MEYRETVEKRISEDRMLISYEWVIRVYTWFVCGLYVYTSLPRHIDRLRALGRKQIFL
jgi:hypothetical protein